MLCNIFRRVFLLGVINCYTTLSSSYYFLHNDVVRWKCPYCIKSSPRSFLYDDMTVDFVYPNETHARLLANHYGMEFVGQVFKTHPIYHLKVRKKNGNSFALGRPVFTPLQLDSMVTRLEIQTFRPRERRSSEFWTKERKKEYQKEKQKLKYKNYNSVSEKYSKFKETKTIWEELRKYLQWYNRSYEENLYTKRLHKRNAPNTQTTHEDLIFNDPMYKDQWYLHNERRQRGESGHDLKVFGPWSDGIAGDGITISIIDDGIQYKNKEIERNFAKDVSYSLLSDSSKNLDPSPATDTSTFVNSHGTYCAGIASAVANNRHCGIGIAYRANIGGVRVVESEASDLQESIALSRHIDRVDIFSAAWGPTDDGTHVDGPGRLATLALNEGTSKGRAGKGVIYVWASGNGGVFGDNCNLDGYASSIYTLSVSALTHEGKSVFYGEPCSSTIAGVLVGGHHIVTEDNPEINVHPGVVVPELDGSCRNSFQGTSAAAPLMAGIVALALQTNPALTWRDIQHLVVSSAEPTREALSENGWVKTGKGKLFHPKQGFGSVNVSKMIELARKWENVKIQKMDFYELLNKQKDVSPKSWSNASYELNGNSVRSSEHCIVRVALRHPRRGNLEIFVISPSGTTSQLLTRREKDLSPDGFDPGWNFMTVQFWGEDPRGIWSVAILNSGAHSGKLYEIHVTLYGV